MNVIQKNLIDVFADVENIVDEKLDRAVEFYKRKKVVPKAFNIAGIDGTQGGERLTHEAYTQHQKRVTQLAKDRETLKIAVAKFNALIMPKEVFDTLRKRLGLFALYPNGKDNWYITDRLSGVGFWDAAFTAPSTIFGILVYSLLFAIYWVVGRVAKAVVRLVAGAPKKLPLTYWFPDLTLSTTKEHLGRRKNVESVMSSGTRDSVQIRLPAPPDKTLDIMNDVVKTIPQNAKYQIITIADEKSIGFTLRKRTNRQPFLIADPHKHDPGLVVEYGTYVAILPDTFYFITAMEQSFIDQATEVAERWDARKYIFN